MKKSALVLAFSVLILAVSLAGIRYINIAGTAETSSRSDSTLQIEVTDGAATFGGKLERP